MSGNESSNRNNKPVAGDDGMEGTGGPETTGKMLSRRLAESVGSHTRINERSATEEAELLECFHRENVAIEIPGTLPDFIGSEHEVWSDGEWVTKATLPGTYGRRLWGERRAKGSAKAKGSRKGQAGMALR